MKDLKERCNILATFLKIKNYFNVKKYFLKKERHNLGGSEE